MSRSEFNRWWTDYATRFPDTGKWLQSHDARAEILAVWLDALASTDIRDALEVNRQLTTGETERWKNAGGYHEREETPAMIRKLAWGARQRRTAVTEPPERLEKVTPSKFPISILFAQLCEVNDRWAKNPDFDKYAEHRRLQAEFLDKYGEKPKANEDLAAYNQREFAP